MTLRRYYRNAVIYPSILVVVLMTIFSIYDNSDYKSEWLTAGFVIETSIFFSLIFSIIISGLSLTIFLNHYKKIRENLIWNVLSWFLLPFGFISLILYLDVSHSIEFQQGLGNDFIYDLILTVPFIIGLSFTFLTYTSRKKFAMKFRSEHLGH